MKIQLVIQCRSTAALLAQLRSTTLSGKLILHQSRSLLQTAMVSRRSTLLFVMLFGMSLQRLPLLSLLTLPFLLSLLLDLTFLSFLKLPVRMLLSLTSLLIRYSMNIRLASFPLRTPVSPIALLLVHLVDQLILLEVMEIILLLRTLKRRLLVPTSRLLPVALMELISSRCS